MWGNVEQFEGYLDVFPKNKTCFRVINRVDDRLCVAFGVAVI